MGDVMDKVKIVSFEIENVKRVQAVSLTPAETGLTTLGGNNRQGKSSCLDGIMSALGGEKFTPRDPVRDGAAKGQTTVKLSNGVTVVRTFTDKGTYLKVDAPMGSKKAGQGLLNDFISAFALDLSSFLNATDKERANILLEIIGVDLNPFDEKISKLEADRLAVGRQEVKAKGHAESMPYDEAAGTTLLTPTDVMTELEHKVNVNAKNRQIRERAEAFQANVKLQVSKIHHAQSVLFDAEEKVTSASAELKEQQCTLARMEEEYKQAFEQTESLKDEDTTALKSKLAEIDARNAQIRQNLERDKALSEVESHHEEYLNLQHQIETIRDEKKTLLDGASMPLEDLSVENGVLIYKGHAWDCMSHAEQLMASTAICRAINPKMGFVLIDKLESMDVTTLKEFGKWLEREGLQAITTRVSRGDECSVIIEDGLIKEETETIKFD
jgi:hypothetical protein